jgi:hypothetical protein
MNNLEAAALLSTIGTILDLQGENPFKVRAFHNAARTIEGLEVNFGKLIDENTLGELPGIGKAMVEKLTELHRTGKLKYYEELRASVPAGVLEIMKLPNLGPKKVKILRKEPRVTTPAQPEARHAGERLRPSRDSVKRASRKFSRVSTGPENTRGSTSSARPSAWRGNSWRTFNPSSSAPELPAVSAGASPSCATSTSSRVPPPRATS